MKAILVSLTLLLAVGCHPVTLGRHGHGESEGGTTVNRGIRVAAGSRLTKGCTSVNGSIRVEEGSTLRSLSTVNGAIRVDADCAIQGDVSSVNGSVSLADRTRVEGDLDTVNGRIDLEHALVARDLSTVNGDIHLVGAKVGGSVLIKGRQQGSSFSRIVIHLSQGAEVGGDIRVEDPSRNVEVRMDASSTVRGQVQGARLQKP